MNITVYLGASVGNDPAFLPAVQELGNWIGSNGHALVYGGATTGPERRVQIGPDGRARR